MNDFYFSMRASHYETHRYHSLIAIFFFSIIVQHFNWVILNQLWIVFSQKWISILIECKKKCVELVSRNNFLFFFFVIPLICSIWCALHSYANRHLSFVMNFEVRDLYIYCQNGQDNQTEQKQKRKKNRFFFLHKNIWLPKSNHHHHRTNRF